MKVHVQAGPRKLHIGDLADGVFSKEVYTSKHLFRKLDAWGLDAQTLRNMPIKEIHVKDLEEQTKYVVDIQTILTDGTYLHFKPNRAQIFLPRKAWKKSAI